MGIETRQSMGFARAGEGNDMIGNIKPVLDLALEYDPWLATKDISTIYTWITQGCDIEKDILPVMKETIKRRPKDKPKINSFSYFSNPILASRDKREMEAAAKELAAKPIDETTRAKANAWKRKMEMQYEQEFLNKYEQVHGRIEA